jgi:cob(I)alamin adenosyltransferase
MDPGDVEWVDEQDDHYKMHVNMHHSAHLGEVLSVWLPDGKRLEPAAAQLHICRTTGSKAQ